jgi:hypothetical protein
MTVNITDLYQQLFGRNGTNKGTDIDMAEHGRAGGISTGQGFKFVDYPQYSSKITVVGSVTYIGIAVPGSTQSDPVWQVKKVDETNPDEVVVTWCDGNSNFDNVATDLTALTYL